MRQAGHEAADGSVASGKPKVWGEVWTGVAVGECLVEAGESRVHGRCAACSSASRTWMGTGDNRDFHIYSTSSINLVTCHTWANLLSIPELPTPWAVQ